MLNPETGSHRFSILHRRLLSSPVNSELPKELFPLNPVPVTHLKQENLVEMFHQAYP